MLRSMCLQASRGSCRLPELTDWIAEIELVRADCVPPSQSDNCPSFTETEKGVRNVMAQDERILPLLWVSDESVSCSLLLIEVPMPLSEPCAWFLVSLGEVSLGAGELGFDA